MSEAQRKVITAIVTALRRTGVIDKCTIRAIIEDIQQAADEGRASEPMESESLDRLVAELSAGPLRTFCSSMPAGRIAA